MDFYSLIRNFVPVKLSIIIPVYRVEATLDRCVESVLNQNLDDFEVILVDDGSPDNCPKMCDDWAEKDSRIRVIHKQNGGLSDARNAGIDQTLGDYITFVDSDDYISPNTLRQNMEILTDHPELDFIEYPIYIHIGSAKEHIFKPQFKIYNDANAYWIEGEAYQHTYACNKIFKRELFQDLEFPPVPAFEDAHLLPKILEKCSTFATTDKGLYYYTWNNNSITATADGKKEQLLLDAYIALLPRFYSLEGYTVQKFYLQALNTQMVVATKGMPITLPPIKHKLNISKHHSLKTNLKILILKFLGINTLCKIYSIISRI